MTAHHGSLSKDRRLTVFTEEGDVFLYDHEKNERRQLTRTVEVESNRLALEAVVLRDGNRVGTWQVADIDQDRLGRRSVLCRLDSPLEPLRHHIPFRRALAAGRGLGVLDGGEAALQLGDLGRRSSLAVAKCDVKLADALDR